MNPSDFRRQGKGIYSKIRQVKRKNGQPSKNFEAYVCDTNENTSHMQSHIEIKSIDAIYTVGTSCIGATNLSSTLQNVITWARPKG